MVPQENRSTALNLEEFSTLTASEAAPLGKITITPRAIARIASNVALQSYGIVGMAAKSLVTGLARRLTHDPTYGVDVTVKDGHILVELYVIVEYGTRISSVATSVANSVRYQIERALGMPVAAVNVHVQGLRISDTD